MRRHTGSSNNGAEAVGPGIDGEVPCLHRSAVSGVDVHFVGNAEGCQGVGGLFDHGQIVEPTCAEYGCTRFVCTRCGEFEDIDIVPALGHQWGEGTARPANCTEDACTEYRCTVPDCDGLLWEDIQEGTATGHLFSQWETDSDGNYVRTCETCATTETLSELHITQTVSGVVIDVNQVPYTLYKLHIGTEESPSVYCYRICDYTNSDMVLYRFEPEQGLVVVVEPSFQEVTLPLWLSSLLMMFSDGTYTIE